MSWKRQQLLAIDPAANAWNIIFVLLLLLIVDVLDVDEVLVSCLVSCCGGGLSDEDCSSFIC